MKIYESKSNSTGDKKLQGGERKTFNATEEFNGANSFGEIYNQREFDSKIREDRKRIIRAIDDILQSEFARQNISNTLRIFIEETKDFIRKKIREKNSFRKGNDNIQLRNDTGLSLGTENEIRKLGRRIYGESDDGDRKFTREYERNNGIFTNEKFDTKDGGNFIEQNREIVSKPRESMEDGNEQNKLDNIIQKSNNDNSKDWTDTEDNSTEFLSDEIINNISSNERREKIFNNDKEFNRVTDTNSASNLQSSSAINNTNNKFNDVGISNEIDEKSNQSDMGNGEFKIKETQFNEGDENVNQGTGFNTEHRILQTETRRSGFKTFKTYEFLRRYEVDGYKGDYEINLSVKERIKLNLEAIKLTQKIFEENRIFANDEEKIILAKYSGFGGLKDLFYDEKYKDIKNELFDLVGEKYFKELKDSSDSAYYTPDFVIKNMYLGLENFGVSKNEKIKALEPSCGIGRFVSLAPNNYEFEAIEKDTITATIAKFLHPNVKIYNSSFEKVNFTKEYDVIIGNPPYGNSNIKDISSLGNNLSLHNYFFVKSAEIVKPNGIVNFIISSYFLDSKGKFKFVEEKASKEVQMNEKQEIVDNFKDEILSIQRKNKIEDNILTESVDFNDNTQNKSLEEKINLVLQMQKETEYIQRPKEILK
ncbi:Eco57I restriction-modification methylase domain-containing protein [Campylobacter coli]|uniref:Eco57I restriction-modification methylase domain-containing protein n=1 Tax=Campylobacter coli TaxID=195 RepID=UPI0036704DFA